MINIQINDAFLTYQHHHDWIYMTKKSQAFCLVLLLIISAFLIFGLTGLSRLKKTTSMRNNGKPSIPHQRFLKNGPYGKKVNFTEQKGDFVLNYKADEIYFVKTKTKFFTTSLLKKLVAKELTVSLYKNEKRLLSFYKKKVKIPVGVKTISIKKPEMQFPIFSIQPEKITISRSANRVTFVIDGKKKACDLTTTTIEDFMASYIPDTRKL